MACRSGQEIGSVGVPQGVGGQSATSVLLFTHPAIHLSISIPTHPLSSLLPNSSSIHSCIHSFIFIHSSAHPSPHSPFHISSLSFHLCTSLSPASGIVLGTNWGAKNSRALLQLSVHGCLCICLCGELSISGLGFRRCPSGYPNQTSAPAPSLHFAAHSNQFRFFDLAF